MTVTQQTPTAGPGRSFRVVPCQPAVAHQEAGDERDDEAEYLDDHEPGSSGATDTGTGVVISTFCVEPSAGR